MRSAMRPPRLVVPLLLLLSAQVSLASSAPGLQAAAWLQRLQGQPEMPAATTMSARNLARLHFVPQGAVLQGPQHSWQHMQAVPGKRDPFGINARGFHEDVFHRDYGSFHPMRRRRSENEANQLREKRSPISETKRRPEMDAAGFYGDTFSNGLGEFWPLKKRWASVKNDNWRRWYKRKPEMDSSGFFGDTFSNGFGDFWTMKKKNGEPLQDIYKRKPEMDSAGFYGDTFTNGFGDFWTVKKKFEKRRPEMDSAGFYGDTFSNGFGDFWTVKKRSADKIDTAVARAPLQSDLPPNNVQ